MEWELQEEYEDGSEFWFVGEKKRDKNFGEVWTFLADVFIDKRKNKCEITFDMYTFPRHLVEDSGWKTLQDGINDLKISIKEMERLAKKSKELGIRVVSDEFVGFKTTIRVSSIEKSEIEPEILRVKNELKL